MNGITLERFQELREAEIELLEKANRACTTVLQTANDSGGDVLTPDQDAQFRKLTKIARRHSCRIELLEQLMKEAAITTTV